MIKAGLRTASLLVACSLAAMAQQGLVVGQKLPAVEIKDLGVLVPATKVEKGRMVLLNQGIQYRSWQPKELTGKVWTLYHMAARLGMDEVNKAFIEALKAANLPEFAPDSPYKTVTVLNLDDAIWGGASMGRSRLEKSQREYPHAIHVADAKGLARAAWSLKPKTSSVTLVDRDGTVLFSKEGQLSGDEISKVLGLIKARVGGNK